MKCGLHCPPGNEMYRLNDIKLFHLASRDQPVYSERLGRLVRLLCMVEHTSGSPAEEASARLPENDVPCVPSFEELDYFILTIQDRSGSHLAGILSYVSTYSRSKTWHHFEPLIYRWKHSLKSYRSASSPDAVLIQAVNLWKTDARSTGNFANWNFNL